MTSAQRQEERSALKDVGTTYRHMGEVAAEDTRDIMCCIVLSFPIE
jgi:hypothetical protein